MKGDEPRSRNSHSSIYQQGQTTAGGEEGILPTKEGEEITTGGEGYQVTGGEGDQVTGGEEYEVMIDEDMAETKGGGDIDVDESESD